MAIGLSETFKGKSVFITGHTGFKGAWLSFWLSEMGAGISGYSLGDALPDKSLYASLSIQDRINKEYLGDIRDFDTLRNEIKRAKPDFIFHLAAQPLVRHSYNFPTETYSTNVNGTIHLLEALRDLKRPCVVIVVTTDKCYENKEDGRAFRETDPLGGFDPYSSSKACAEIVVSSWRNSFFNSCGILVASARAGNVIGGGDWAQDRIVPDAVRSLLQKAPIGVRNPTSVRPWQHVLDPLNGYLELAHVIHQKAAIDLDEARSLCTAFNFGPQESSSQTVQVLVDEILSNWNGKWVDNSSTLTVHEASMLKLDIAKARNQLNWYPVWSFKDAISETINWYKMVHVDNKSAEECTRANLSKFESAKQSLYLQS